MKKIVNPADDFHQAMLPIITESYQNQSLSTHDWEVSNIKLQKKLDRLKAALSVWQQEDYPWPDTAYHEGVPTRPYKKAIMGNYKELFDAFSDFLKSSDIFSKQEKRDKTASFIGIMSVLKASKNPKPIGVGERSLLNWRRKTNNNGLLQRDLTHNHRYWDAAGAHIQVGQDLCEVLTDIVNIAISDDLNEKREDLQNALSTIFTTDMCAYDKCPGAHSDNIREAKYILKKSPEAFLISDLRDYIKILMVEEINNSYGSHGSSRIIDVLPVAEQRHFPSAMDFLSGVSKDIIVQKDGRMYNGFLDLQSKHLSFLIDKVFEFSKFLVEKINNEISDLLHDFDDLGVNKKNDKVNEIDAILRRYEQKDTHSTDFRDSLFDEDKGDFLEASHIKEKAMERFSLLIGAITGIENIDMEQVSQFEVSASKRIEYIPEEFNLLVPLVMLYALKGDKESLSLLKDSYREPTKKDIFYNVLKKFALRKNKLAIKTLVDSCTESMKEAFVTLLLKYARDNEREKFRNLQAICPEALKIEVFSDVFLTHLLRTNRPLLHKFPKAIIGKVLVKVLSDCAIEKNQFAFNKALRSLPKRREKYVYILTLLECVYTNDSSAIKMVADSCPKAIKSHVFVSALYSIFCTGNQLLFNKLKEACPKDIERDVLTSVLSYSVSIGDDSLVFNKLLAFYSEDIKEAIFSEIISDYITKGDLLPSKMLDMANISPELEFSIYAKLVITYAEQGNEEAINDLLNLCSSDIREEVLCEAMRKLSEMKKTDVLEIVRKVYMEYLETTLTEEMKMNSKDSVDIDFVDEISLTVQETDSSDDVLLAVPDILEFDSDGYALNFEGHGDLNFSDDIVTENAFFDSLKDYIDDNEKISLEFIQSNCPDKLQVKVFARGIVYALKNTDNEVFKRTVDACPTGLEEAIFTEAIAICRKNGDKEAIAMIEQSCPENLKDKIFNPQEKQSVEISPVDIAARMAVGSSSKSWGKSVRKKTRSKFVREKNHVNIGRF